VSLPLILGLDLLFLAGNLTTGVLLWRRWPRLKQPRLSLVRVALGIAYAVLAVSFVVSDASLKVARSTVAINTSLFVGSMLAVVSLRPTAHTPHATRLGSGDRT
jgi:hypothetical protein